MIKYTEIKAIWASGASPIEGMYLDRIYSILNKDDKFYVTDGNAEILFDEFCIKNFLTPKDNISWSEVDFSNEINEFKVVKNDKTNFKSQN